MARGRRKASAELTLKDNMGRGLRVARGRLKSFARQTRSMVGGAMRGIGFGALLGGAGIVAALAAAGREVIDFEKRLTRLQIQSGRTAREMGGFRDLVNDISRETGLSRDDLLDAGAKFVSLTGDMDTATKSLGLFAKVAVASGASVADVASTADTVKNMFDVDPSQLEDAFSILLRSGKVGSLELKEMATVFSGVANDFTKFGVDGSQGLAELASVFQLVTAATKDPARSMTQIRGLLADLVNASGRLRKNGIEVFETKGDEKRLKSVPRILEAISKSKLVQDPELMAKVFRNMEGRAALEQILRVPEALDKMVASTRDAKDVAEDYKTFMESPAGRIEKAANDAKQAMLEAFTPENIKDFAGAMERVAKLVNDAADHIERIRAFLSGDTDNPTLRDAAGASPRIAARRKQIMKDQGVGPARAAAIEEGERLGHGRAAGPIGDRLHDFKALPTSTSMLGFTPGSPLDSLSGHLGGGDQPLIPGARPPGQASRWSSPQQVDVKVENKLIVEPTRDFDIRIEQRRRDWVRRSVE
jgi:TP901 family phage tail tape measure protein